MSTAFNLGRRRLLARSASSALMLGLTGLVRRAAAEAPMPQSDAQRLIALENRARRLGIHIPLGDAAGSATRSPRDQEAYSELLPRLLDVIHRADSVGGSAAALAEDAAELLGSVHRNERSFAPVDAAERAVAPSFDILRGEYRRLFDTCTLDPSNVAKVDQHVEMLRRYRPRYEKVGVDLDVPWHFIGIIHALEAGFNFRTHLHNGDPLTARTVQEPKNRPAVWAPPTDWEASAEDALRIKKFDGQSDWSIERTLYRWELYNGFGYRNKRAADGSPVYTPYLWSFTDQYRKGKYVRDGVWDPQYVSQQCGAGAMLKRLIEAGDVAPT
jgi:lysozyme family protein